MQIAAQPSPLARDDTLLGVCQALGEDFGFNPTYLRIALGVALLWNPVVVIGAYAAAALVLGLSHWLFPNPAAARATFVESWTPAMQAPAGHAAPEGDNDQEAMAVAA